MSSPPTSSIDRGIVAILSLSGKRRLGTGFIISEQGYIATCAHVLKTVFGEDPADGRTLRLRFAATGAEGRATVKESWYRGEAAEDVAIVVLDETLPPEVAVLPLKGAAQTVGHEIRSFGYPDYEAFDGLGATGTVVAHISQGGIARLQLESSQITQGYSGGPIWDDALAAVIGQVVSGVEADKLGKHQLTAFATPAETLLALIGADLVERMPFEPQLVPVPKGPFLMGSPAGDDIDPHETPQFEFSLPAYEIGQFPVTNAQYAAFIEGADYQLPGHWLGSEPPEGKEEHPVVNVSWLDAAAYCEWLRGETGRPYRLPTEAEWEKAARGAEGLRYPWGNQWRKDHCNHSGAGTTPICAFKKGVSPYGCHDMLGNVREWTNTIWGSDAQKAKFSYPYRSNDKREALDADPALYRIIRGSSYQDPPKRHRTSARTFFAASSTSKYRGFRVVVGSLQ